MFLLLMFEPLLGWWKKKKQEKASSLLFGACNMLILVLFIYTSNVIVFNLVCRVSRLFIIN